MRYVCIHGHFYQPPRENPWLEAVELQDSAYPYHDWNARIDAECYSRNVASRILDDARRIKSIVNNLASISFNFGPTLLSWMEANAPETYAGVLAADRLSQTRFGGHGSAMAQPYNHMILPLANARDQDTQVVWGIRDFERRFGRRPAGMWLPETAVDLATLEVLARHGIRFTVLSPYQARSVRRLANVEAVAEPEADAEADPGAEWEDVQNGRIDPTRAYLQRLPSGRSMALFFYDGPVSRAVAFERLLDSGEALAGRIVGAFSDERDWPQLMHIATDGESYGHHHRHGDMALAYALHHIEREGLAELINYGAYLERHPPTHEVEILERTAWSCAHGVGRWSADCGCHTGAHSGWNQAWRAPLRAALDWLRDQLAPVYEELGGELFTDCWAARDAYVDVVIDRAPERVAGFLAEHGRGDAAANVRRLELLEMQRHAMLMYTSCGWFFDDVAGIESVQVIEYAARALQLAERVSGRPFEAGFLERLAAAASNDREQGDGRRIYETRIKPAMIDPLRVGAHYAVSSVFVDYPASARIYCYGVERQVQEVREVGPLALRAGRARILDTLTQATTSVGYVAAHVGLQNVAAGVTVEMQDADWQRMLEDVDQALHLADIPELVRRIDRHFAGRTFSIRSLFRDEQRKVLEQLLRDTLEQIEATYLDIHQRHARLGLLLTELNIPIPAPLKRADERAINHQLETALAGPEFDPDRVRLLLDAARRRRTDLDETRLEFTFRRALEALADRLERGPEDDAVLHELELAVEVMAALPFSVNLWRVQNAFFAVVEGRVRGAAPPRTPDSPAAAWAGRLLALGPKLGVAVA